MKTFSTAFLLATLVLVNVLNFHPANATAAAVVDLGVQAKTDLTAAVDADIRRPSYSAPDDGPLADANNIPNTFNLTDADADANAYADADADANADAEADAPSWPRV